MSNDELNKAIYEAVLKESTGFFEHIDVPDGTYTASALAKLSDNNELNIDPDFNASEEVNIHVNRFKCSFLKKSLFHMLKKFEKLAKIKKKYLFSKLSEKDVPYDIQGESFPYSERHLHLPTSTQPIEINNQETIKTPVQEQDYTMLMATVNKTQKRYSIDSLIEGEYEIREQHHDPDLVLAIRSMAHYLKGDKELQVKVIKNFEQHYGCPKDNPDYFLNYPLPELELATRFSEVFEAEGIYDIPDYPSAEPSSVQQHESVPEEENNSSIRSGLVGGKNIIPIMTLETSQGPMIISTYDSFSVLDASDDPRDHELIDRIDAFISSATFNADPLDMEAIASEMEEFFNLVEAEGHAI